MIISTLTPVIGTDCQVRRVGVAHTARRTPCTSVFPLIHGRSEPLERWCPLQHHLAHGVAGTAYVVVLPEFSVVIVVGVRRGAVTRFRCIGSVHCSSEPPATHYWHRSLSD